MPSPFYDVGPRYGLRALQGSSLVSDIDSGFLALRDDIEAKMVGYKTGTRAARLAATNLDGLVWRETDTGALLLGTGTVWVPLNLVPLAVPANQVAIDGAMHLVAAGVTLTLPTAPAAGAVVGIVAGSAATAANAITVSRGGTATISGEGLAAVTSFKLDAPSATVTLLYDGTNWVVIAGKADAGFQPARAYLGTTFTPTTGAFQVTPIAAVSYDPGGYFDVVTNHRYNVPADGTYEVNVSNAINPGSACAVGVGILKNGTLMAQTQFGNAPAGFVFISAVTDKIKCVAGDSIQLAHSIQLGSVGAGSVGTASPSTFIAVQRVF